MPQIAVQTVHRQSANAGRRGRVPCVMEESGVLDAYVRDLRQINYVVH